MAHGLNTPGLTLPEDPVLAARLAATVPGMAHYAGTGPVGATCRSCAFWGTAKRFYRRQGGELRRRHCEKFLRMMQGRKGSPIPHHKDACRHFEKSPNEVPTVERPAKPEKPKNTAKKKRTRARKRKG